MSEISKYALLGAKLSHSLSPAIHSDILKYIGITGDYELVEVDRSQLFSTIERFKNSNYKGCNVTVPYKVDIMKYLDEISPEASKIGAINTVLFKDNKTTGYNTDYFGFGKMLQINHVEFKGKIAVILGTGGASKAVYQYLIDNKVGEVYFATTNVDQAKNKYKGCNILSYQELENFDGGYLICNCTPVGMSGHSDLSLVEETVLRKFQVAVDLIYNPKETKFLNIAKNSGLQAVNGLYMLVAQAVKAQEIWQNKTFEDEIIDRIYYKLSGISNNIVLLGLPGCGKTTIGRLVAEKLGLKFVDIDNLIESEQQMSISQIFKQKGEEYFRKLESTVLKEILNGEGKVISTGGGIVEDLHNRELIKENGINVYIDRSVDNILQDLDNSIRPLLADNKNRLYELYERRHKLYSECANYVVDNNEAMELAVTRVCNIYINKNSEV